jgi:GT2 family glycosyltransferase
METIEPAAISAELLDADQRDGTEPTQVVPPVVAVVVTNDAGPWLEATLGALAAQDYPALSVLVLDNGSTEDPTPRIAAAMPRAFVRRRAENAPDGLGFSAAANEALDAVEGATFLCFLHDDSTLDPDAIRLMVEEAYRSNAGIVGPKLVDQDHPDILLEVGMAVDHYGVPFSGIEPEEVDQEQHDGVRDVFFVSHAAMLVRTDLFHTLGGFDPATFPGADDIDLCWRARLAGARVIVAPAARVRHKRATLVEAPLAEQQPTDIRAETRSRVRLLCKSYSALALVWVLPVSLVLALGESIGLLVTGRARRAAALLAGWFSPFARPRVLFKARRQTQHMRRVDDGDVRDLMIRGSARMRMFFTQRTHAADRFSSVSERTRVRMTEASEQLKRAPAIIGTILAVLVLFGSRSLLFDTVPQVGGFRAWPGIGDAWATFTGAWRGTFMGSGNPATPAFGLMAVLNTVLLGHAGLARSLVVGGALAVGTWGVYRVLRPLTRSALPAVTGAVAYAANPIARNAIFHGEIGPLVCFALAPFVLGVFVRLFDEERPRPSFLHATLTIALLLAIGASVWPPAILFAALLAISFCLAAPFAHDRGIATRSVVIAVGGTGIAVLLCTPWVWSLLGSDAATRGAQPRAALTLLDVLHFDTGSAGAGIASWGIVAAAVVPLLIAHGPRLAWATRAWMLAIAAYAAAWLPARISPGSAVLSPNGLLVGAALGLAFAAGLGVAAILDDLRTWHFGWRQIVTVVACAGLALALVGFAADTLDGRFGLGSGDWASSTSWMHVDNPKPGGFRVLWLGDPNVLPADAKVAGATGFATTRDGAGDARALWAAPESSADRVLADAITSAEAGTTSRLGHLVAPAGVRYIAFINRAAPDSGARGAPNPQLAAALGRQLDLTLSRLDDNGVIYENDAWLPMHAVVPANAKNVNVTATDPLPAALRSEPTGVQGIPVKGGATPAIGPGTLLWSEAANGGWHASAGGSSAQRRDAFGWTNAFTLDNNAKTHVSYRGGTTTSLFSAGAVLAWIVALGAWFVTRGRRRARGRL